jgi:hypothetical protein
VIEEFELATSGSAGVDLVVMVVELVVMVVNIAIAIISPVATLNKLNVAKVSLVMHPVKISAIAVVVVEPLVAKVKPMIVIVVLMIITIIAPVVMVIFLIAAMVNLVIMAVRLMVPTLLARVVTSTGVLVFTGTDEMIVGVSWVEHSLTSLTWVQVGSRLGLENTVAIGGAGYVSRCPRREGTLGVACLGSGMGRVA